MSAVRHPTPEPASSPARDQSPSASPARSAPIPTPRQSDAAEPPPPPRSGLSPVQLYKTEWVTPDMGSIRIPHGCTGVVEKPDGLSVLPPGERLTDPLLTPEGTGFWLHTVWTTPVPVYLRVKARSRDGWPLRLALLAVVQVNDPLLVVQSPRPSLELRSLLTSIVTQALGEHSALALNGAAPGPTVRETLTAIIELYIAEARAGRGVPGLTLRRLDIVQSWTDSALVERLQQRGGSPASQPPAPATADEPPPPPDTTAPDPAPTAVSPTMTPDPVEPELPPAPPSNPPAPTPAPRPPINLVEAVVRQLVYEGRLRLPKTRREGLPPGETLDADTVAYLRALVAREWAAQALAGEEGAHG